jgi:hypothetical protein
MGHHVFKIPKHWYDDIDILLPCKSRIRKWAFENAYTLIVMGTFFVITWAYLVVDKVTR